MTLDWLSDEASVVWIHAGPEVQIAVRLRDVAPEGNVEHLELRAQREECLTALPTPGRWPVVTGTWLRQRSPVRAVQQFDLDRGAGPVDDAGGCAYPGERREVGHQPRHAIVAVSVRAAR
jgi:hypothetical protein